MSLAREVEQVAGGEVAIPEDLTVRVEQDGQGAVLVLTGELDLASGETFSDRLQAVEAGRPELITLDLSGLRFLDSSGLALVVRAHTRARNEGRRLVIIPGPPQVQRVFDITGLNTVLELEDGR
jgi:anti-sigma B factor antagonist